MLECIPITLQRLLVLPYEPIDVAQGFVDPMYSLPVKLHR